MIFLEQIVNQVLKEEGQTIISLEDLQIKWEDVEALFIGVYEQSKAYLSIYDWVNDTISSYPSTREDYASIRHMTYNINTVQRFMPDFPGMYWEFNPYTKNVSSLANMNYSLEVAKYPTLENLTYSTTLNLTENTKKYFQLPCTFNVEDFSFSDFIAYKKDNIITLESDSGVGQFNEKTLNGYVISDTDYSGTLKIKSKYVGIKELDLTAELFYIWFKAALMQYIGAIKKQLDLSGVGLPFDINADTLLERGRQLMDSVNELKTTKQHWSNF